MKQLIISLLVKLRDYIAPIGYEDARGFHLGEKPREW